MRVFKLHKSWDHILAHVTVSPSAHWGFKMGPLLLNVLDKPVKEAGDKLWPESPTRRRAHGRGEGKGGCLCAQPGTAKHH